MTTNCEFFRVPADVLELVLLYVGALDVARSVMRVSKALKQIGTIACVCVWVARVQLPGACACVRVASVQVFDCCFGRVLRAIVAAVLSGVMPQKSKTGTVEQDMCLQYV